jgi:hypothetical protein
MTTYSFSIVTIIYPSDSEIYHVSFHMIIRDTFHKVKNGLSIL